MGAIGPCMVKQDHPPKVTLQEIWKEKKKLVSSFVCTNMFMETSLAMERRRREYYFLQSVFLLIGGSLMDSLQSLTRRGMRDWSYFPISARSFLMHSHMACRSALVFACSLNVIVPLQQLAGGLASLPCMYFMQGVRSLVTVVHVEVAFPAASGDAFTWSASLSAFRAACATPESNKTMAKTPTRVVMAATDDMAWK